MYLLTRSCSAVLPQAAGRLLLFLLFAFSFSFNGYHAVDVGLQQEMCNAWNKISAFDLNGILLTDTQPTNHYYYDEPCMFDDTYGHEINHGRLTSSLYIYHTLLYENELILS
jgi:hypothetical protein